MSRLARAPFHKPSLHDIPRPVHPLSPPDTEDSLPLNYHAVSREASSSDLSMSFVTKVDPTDQYQSLPMDASTPKVFRRPSTLNYVHSGPARDARSAPRPATRWLIIVSPPPSVTRNIQSSTLFLNPTNRTSHGILLPLLPSLSGQLTSIAREYAFPSTSGICIYLTVNDSGLGVDFSLRVSDDSWPILWSNALGLDERQQQPPSAMGFGGLPIAGRIEFDLDVRKARWFESWVTACRRNSDAGISAAPSIRHYRDGSRTSVTHDQLEESVPDDISVTIQQKVPVVRHVPRKLSLLDRVETHSHRSSLSRPASRNGFSFPQRDDGLHVPAHVLTPVDGGLETEDIEDEEPQTASQRVGKKVESWRASSNFAASPLAATTGQTALEPANMPNTLMLNTPSDAADLADEDGEHVLNLDDFTWSISSAGPSTGAIEPDSDSALFANWRAPSVHLAERLEGSVCLTPSTATSWGAPDYDPLSPAMSLAIRLPSPDIAARHIDDAPLTPMTATSWGAPSEWPASPALSSRAPSVDLGARCMDSRPVTPSTATSWGAPLEWPESPATPYYVRTPDIGEMVFDEDDVALPHVGVATENWRYVWPYNEERHGGKPLLGWNFVWPYFSANDEASVSQIRVSHEPGYPYINPYPAAYPNFDLYPAMPEAQGKTRGVDMTLKASYPLFSIYPATYPSFEIYPGHVVSPQENSMKSLTVNLNVTYPSIELYPAVYPHFNIYPAKPAKAPDPSNKPVVSAVSTNAPSYRSVVVKLEYNYPVFNLYPAVYPDNMMEIYPTSTADSSEVTSLSVKVKLAPKYPYFDIYPAMYPHFNLYPSKASISARESRSLPVVASERVVYPHFDLYPPRQGRETKQTSKIESPRQVPVIVRLAPKYPQLDIYPPVYPNLYIYPPTLSRALNKVINVQCDVRYPSFDIYPAVYPYFDIYRSGIATRLENWREPKSVKLEAKYPAVSIYSPVYPYFDIYNTGSPTKAELLSKEVQIRLPVAYPAFNIYPPVYPHFDIYNTGISLDLTPVFSKLSTRLEAKYPTFDIYPAIYPNFQLYPSVQPVMPTIPRKTRKTHRELHELVMSRLPTPVSSSPVSSFLLSSRDRRPRRTHKELHEMVFPNGSQPTVSSSSPSPSTRTSPNDLQLKLSIPIRPSEIRRTVSLNRASRSPSERENVLSRSGSLKKLTPVEELRVSPISSHRLSHSRDHSEGHVDGSPLRRKTRRDSIVLEKARHWGAGAPPSDTNVPDLSAMIEQLDFPMPPPPPLPTKLPSDLNRPIAKLDRSKFPFQ